MGHAATSGSISLACASVRECPLSDGYCLSRLARVRSESAETSALRPKQARVDAASRRSLLAQEAGAFFNDGEGRAAVFMGLRHSPRSHWAADAHFYFAPNRLYERSLNERHSRAYARPCGDQN